MTAPAHYGIPWADAILAQLGGPKIFAMAFASSMHGAGGLTLRIARGLRAKERATHVVVRLEAGDLYTVETLRYPRGRVEGTVVGYAEGVGADNLKAVVESQTGLRLSL